MRRRHLHAPPHRGLGPAHRAARAVARGLLAALDGTRTDGGARARVRRRAGARGARGARRARSCSRTPPTTRACRLASARATTASSATSASSAPRHRRPSEYQRRLREARVVLLGVGGLGSWAAYALACCGVGELVLVDGDVVEESNFNRQILYRERDIGRLKVEAAAEALAEFDSSCGWWRVERRARGRGGDRERRSTSADFVVNSADWPAHDIERWVNAACFDAGVPFITMSHSPPVGARRAALRPGRDGLLRVPGGDLPRAVPALRRAGRAAPRAKPSPAADARAGVRLRRRPGGARGAAPPDRPGARPATLGRSTSTTSGRWRSRTRTSPWWRAARCAAAPRRAEGTRPVPRGTTASRVWPHARLGPESTGRGRV